jgi:hypothetical protein
MRKAITDVCKGYRPMHLHGLMGKETMWEFIEMLKERTTIVSPNGIKYKFGKNPYKTRKTRLPRKLKKRNPKH